MIKVISLDPKPANAHELETALNDQREMLMATHEGEDLGVQLLQVITSTLPPVAVWDVR